MSVPALHCHRVGRGPDLVLLHGWGLHSGIWTPIIEALAARFRLHLIDLPGHGQSESASPQTFTLDALCTVLEQAVPAQAYWLGWSLGGMLALEFAARHPQRVSRLILMASNPLFVAAEDWPQGMDRDVLEGFAQNLLQDHNATLNRFLGLVARGAPDTSVLRELRHTVNAAPPPTESALRGGLAILRDADLRSRLNVLSMPVLLLGGARDTLVPITALRRVQEEHPRMQLREFAQAGHAPFISHPQETAAAITEFLS